MSHMYLINPSKKGKKKRKGKKPGPKKKSVAKRSGKKKAAKKTYRRNPSARGIMQRTWSQQVQPAIVQATGALALDIGYGYLAGFLPVQFTDGPLRHLTKGLSAITISALVASTGFIKRGWANDAAKGALTVIIHDAAKDTVSNLLPGVPLGYYSSAYIPRSVNNLGYYQRRGAPVSASVPQQVYAGTLNDSDPEGDYGEY